MVSGSWTLPRAPRMRPAPAHGHFSGRAGRTRRGRRSHGGGRASGSRRLAVKHGEDDGAGAPDGRRWPRRCGKGEVRISGGIGGDRALDALDLRGWAVGPRLDDRWRFRIRGRGRGGSSRPCTRASWQRRRGRRKKRSSSPAQADPRTWRREGNQPFHPAEDGSAVGLGRDGDGAGKLAGSPQVGAREGVPPAARAALGAPSQRW